jgi:hypothetical protein
VRVLVLCVALAALSCASSSGLKGLPRCETVEFQAHPDWRDIELGEIRFSFPPCFQEEPVPEGLPHGGQSWRCGAVAVDVQWGMWGRDSFPERRLCRTTVAGIPAMVGRPRDPAITGVLVWYLTGEPHQPIISVFGKTPEDSPLATQIAYSGRR